MKLSIRIKPDEIAIFKIKSYYKNIFFMEEEILR